VEGRDRLFLIWEKRLENRKNTESEVTMIQVLGESWPEKKTGEGVKKSRRKHKRVLKTTGEKGQSLGAGYLPASQETRKEGKKPGVFWGTGNKLKPLLWNHPIEAPEERLPHTNTVSCPWLTQFRGRFYPRKERENPRNPQVTCTRPQ